jgi:hypothetical protein
MTKRTDEVFDRIQIVYEDEEAAAEEMLASDNPSEVKILNNYGNFYSAPLQEVEVDKEYVLEMVHPKHKEILMKLRERYGQRGHTPIPYYDLSASLYEIGNKINYSMGKFRIAHILRYLWRAGYIRRYVRSRVEWKVKKGRGEWYGIHYSLYPKSDE